MKKSEGDSNSTPISRKKNLKGYLDQKWANFEVETGGGLFL